MDNIDKLLKMAFNIIVFFLAITLLYSLNNKFNQLIDSTANHITGDNLVFETQPVETKRHITKGEVISILMRELEYDLEVIDETGTYVIQSEGYSPADMGRYSFESNEFEKSYRYTAYGEITKIILHYVK